MLLVGFVRDCYYLHPGCALAFSVAAQRPFAFCLEIYLSARRSPLCVHTNVHTCIHIHMGWISRFLVFLHVSVLFILFWRLKLKFNSAVLMTAILVVAASCLAAQIAAIFLFHWALLCFTDFLVFPPLLDPPELQFSCRLLLLRLATICLCCSFVKCKFIYENPAA